MTRNNPISRRTALKGLGGTLATVGVGGAALLATTGPAAAANFDISDPVVLTSDDGSIEHVYIYGDSVVHWNGFDTPATHFNIDIDAKVTERHSGDVVQVDGNDWHDLHETELTALDDDSWGNYDESLTGPGTHGTIESGIGLDDQGNHDESIDWHIVGGDPANEPYGLPSTPIPASVFKVDEDGATVDYDITMRSTYTWYSSDSDTADIFSEEFTSVIGVDVTNEPESASVDDGTGDDGAGGGVNSSVADSTE